LQQAASLESQPLATTQQLFGRTLIHFRFFVGEYDDVGQTDVAKRGSGRTGRSPCELGNRRRYILRLVSPIFPSVQLCSGGSVRLNRTLFSACGSRPIFF
jgi:hypothetical protein